MASTRQTLIDELSGSISDETEHLVSIADLGDKHEKAFVTALFLKARTILADGRTKLDEGILKPRRGRKPKAIAGDAT